MIATQKKLITSKTALLAHQKEFNQYVSESENSDIEQITMYQNGELIVCYLPTQQMIQEWLSEKHGIDVKTEWFMVKNNYGYLIQRKSYNDLKSKTSFDTEFQAFEFGLQKALKLIKS